MKQQRLESRAGGFIAIVILGMMASLVPLSTDMYLPGFKSIAEDFSTTTSAIQVTLSASFVGIGIGMPIWGPISDRFGRRTPAAIGILLYLVGAILCANAADLSQLVAARFVLALGGAGVMVIGRAIVRDMFVGERMARTLGAVSSVLLVSSIISPSIGAIILQFTDWRWLFMALVILGLAAVAGTLSLPESLPPEKRIRKGLGGTFRQYAEILKDKTFQFSVLQQAFNSAILMSYVACSPSVFMGEFGLSEQTFGAIFGMNALSMLTATQIHRRLLKTRKIPYLLSRLLVFQFVAGMALLAVGLAIHVWWVVIVLTMLSVCVLPSITAGSTTLAMTNFSHAAAQASSVIGLVQSIAAASISAGLVLLPIEPLPRMLAGMSGAAVLALVTLWLRSRQLHRQA